MDKDQSLRDHLLELLRGGSAHLDFEKALAGLPPDLRGTKAPGLPHTVWQLLEHLRIAQWD
ncbi:MAG TPA: DinB family protein, partial [Thermoanaerobaculia bacterium]